MLWCLQLPKKVCKRLMFVITQFWRAENEETKGINTCLKEKLSTRKEHGVSGLRIKKSSI